MAIRLLFFVIPFALFLSGAGAATILENNWCRDSAVVYADRMLSMIEEGRFSDAKSFTYLWKQQCGMNEPLFRATALLLIKTGDFPGFLEEEDLLDFAIAWEIRYRIMVNQDQDIRDDYYQVHEAYFGFIPFNSSFDRRTRTMARELLRDAAHSSLSMAFLRLYSDEPDDFFLMLKEKNIDYQPLIDTYQQRVLSFQKLPEFNLGISTGLWHPSNHLSSIGLKPAIGVLLGIKWENLMINGLFQVRFGNTQQPIEILMQDTLTSTRTFQGGFGGIEFSYQLLAIQNHRAGISLAVGFDLIELIDRGQDASRTTFYSPVFQSGVYWGYVFRNRTMVSVHPAYAFLNHTNQPGSSLAGNALLLNLVFSFSENARKTENLKRLGY